MRHTQLRAFHHVAITGGFTRAAEVMHLTQPAVSDQVRKLEQEYDTRLFERHKSSVELTAQGHRLLDITHRFFAASSSFWRVFDPFSRSTKFSKTISESGARSRRCGATFLAANAMIDEEPSLICSSSRSSAIFPSTPISAL